MAARFTIDLLPALEGDAIWMEWADDDHRGRMLIDGGRGSTTRLGKRLADVFEARPDDRAFDVVVNTHMDADHIAGLIGLFADPPDGFEAREIWFNGLRHVAPFDDGLGIDQSDQLEALVDDYVQSTGARWNESLGAGGAAMVVPDPPSGVDAGHEPDAGDGDETGDGDEAPPLPRSAVAGMTITLLSPTVDRVRRVAREWPDVVSEAARGEAAAQAEAEVEEGTGIGGPEAAAAGLDQADDDLGFDQDKGVDPEELATRGYERDDTPANGASLAFVAEFAGKRVLLGGDAHAEVLASSLGRLQPDGPIHFDAVKLAHHGSEKNLSPELLAMIDCPTWLISTNGSRHHHPDRRAMARLITRRRPTLLVFNYRSEMAREWGKASLTTRFDFTSHLPPDGHPGTRYDVLTGRAGPLP
jgi:hypothetical protein